MAASKRWCQNKSRAPVARRLAGHPPRPTRAREKASSRSTRPRADSQAEKLKQTRTSQAPADKYLAQETTQKRAPEAWTAAARSTEAAATLPRVSGSSGSDYQEKHSGAASARTGRCPPCRGAKALRKGLTDLGRCFTPVKIRIKRARTA